MTREEVYKGLEQADAYFRSSFDAMYGTFACEKFRNWVDAIEHALAMLKEQEARVMGVGDLYGEDMGFYERKGEELVWPVLIARGGPDDDGTVGIIRKDAFEIKADCDLINQTWRIWTAYPTDEQREATPWN